jgi:hypothetical protein
MINGAMATNLIVEKRLKMSLVVALLLMVLVLNAVLLIATYYNRGDLKTNFFYGMNIIVIVLLLIMIILPGLFNQKNPYSGLTTPFYFAVVGTIAGLVLFLSSVACFGNTYSSNGPVALILCILSLAMYIYFVYLRYYV